LHVLLVKHNRVRFNEEGAFIAIPDEVQSMVGTVFGKLARHPAVLRRITDTLTITTTESRMLTRPLRSRPRRYLKT
jgi:hypothetical protein